MTYEWMRKDAALFLMGSLSQDRVNLGEAVKRLALTSRPSTSSMEDLKTLGRYLFGRPSLASRHEQQRMPANIRVSVHSNSAAVRATRKSTTGMVQRLGRHPTQTTSNLQPSVGVNVSECEFYAWVHERAHGLGLQAHVRDLGIDHLLIIESDSSSSKVFASGRDLGKPRHVQTRYLWIQDMVAAKSCDIKKVPTADNISDILTEAIDRKTFDKHLKTMVLVEVRASKLHKQS